MSGKAENPTNQLRKRKAKIARARREKGGKEKKAVVDTLKM